MRLSMLVAGFLALQVTAFGGGVSCLLASSPGYGEATGASMAAMGMALPRSHRGESSAAGAVSEVETNQAPSPSQAPCPMSGSSQSCPSMAPCAAACIPAALVHEAAPVPSPVLRIAFAEVAPASYSRTPDLPPPRA